MYTSANSFGEKERKTLEEIYSATPNMQQFKRRVNFTNRKAKTRKMVGETKDSVGSGSELMGQESTKINTVDGYSNAGSGPLLLSAQGSNGFEKYRSQKKLILLQEPL